jgi:methionyl-tRNA formyltransferase
MINSSKTIIFFGTDNFSLTALKSLVEANYNISAVVTKPDSKSGRGQKIIMSSVKKFAIENNITIWQPDKLSDIFDDIQMIKSDKIGILASFGKIIPESIINLFTPGIINIHPSLLPIYRGPTPIESAIANGDKKTGVSIMKLTKFMDAGPIYKQIEYKLSGSETQPELYEILAEIGANELIKTLPDIINGIEQPKPQDNSKSIYCSLLNKQDSLLDLQKITSASAERLIRAHLSFPKTKINIMGNMIIVTKAHVANQLKSPIDVLCNDNNYLVIDELIAPSGKTMSANDFINGYKL